METTATLSLSDLKAIASGGKTRAYKPDIISFVKSNELYKDFMLDLPYSEKKIDSVYNSFNNNLKELKSQNPDWPHIEVKKEGTMVLIINMTALEGAATDEDES